MFKGFQIIDADAHVLEPNDMWEKYLEPAFQDYALSPDLKVNGEEIFFRYSDKLRDEVAIKVVQEKDGNRYCLSLPQHRIMDLGDRYNGTATGRSIHPRLQ
jgi:hypothetical protein